jgi:hypothetical protein
MVIIELNDAEVELIVRSLRIELVDYKRLAENPLTNERSRKRYEERGMKLLGLIQKLDP